MNNRMNKLIIAMGGLLIAGSVFAEGNADNGKTIFADSECMKCHQSDDKFTRSDRKVQSYPELDAQVRKCDSQLSTNLFDDEIKDVTAYLNAEYYHFTEETVDSADIIDIED